MPLMVTFLFVFFVKMGASLPSLASNQLSKNSDISDQMRVIQVKLQNQLVARHQRLQEDILRQQQELQNVQQQLLNAQQLMFQQSPIIGVSLDQNAKQDQSQRASSSKAANWNVEDVGQDQPATTEARSLNTQQRYCQLRRQKKKKLIESSGTLTTRIMTALFEVTK